MTKSMRRRRQRRITNTVVTLVGLLAFWAAVHVIDNYSGFDMPAGEGDDQILGAIFLFAVAALCALWLACSYISVAIGYVPRKDRD